MKSGISQTNIQAVLYGFKVRRKRRDDTIEKMMRDAATFVYQKSQEYVPIDRGYLARSGKIIVTGSGAGTNAIVSYGDRAAYYALYVHEIPFIAHGAEFNVKYAAEIAAGTEHVRRPAEQYKFLEKALLENLSTIKGIIRKNRLLG